MCGSESLCVDQRERERERERAMERIFSIYMYTCTFNLYVIPSEYKVITIIIVITNK